MVNSFVSAVTPQTLASLIAHMPGMTLSGYEAAIAGSVGTGVSAFVDSTTAGQVADTMSLAEHTIYGSSRLGTQTYDWGAVRNIWKYGTTTGIDSSLSRQKVWYSFAYGDLIDSTKVEPWGNGDVSTFTVTRLLGKRYYEVTDHLGNVLVTVLDRKTGHVNPGISSLYDYYNADIASAQDMYPFGMEMPGRTKNYLDSRFGFNGQMQDNEAYGRGNLNTALFWEYDTRVANRWDRDPVTITSLSPYVVFGGNPILNNDVLGNLLDVATDAGSKSDIMSLVNSDNKKYINIGVSGTVTLNFGSLKPNKVQKLLKQDKGLALISDLVNAKDSKGTNLKFLYSNSANGLIDALSDNKVLSDADFPYRDGEDAYKNDVDGIGIPKKPFFINASKSLYGEDHSGRKAQINPSAGYDGQVTVFPGQAQHDATKIETTTETFGPITTTKNREVPYVQLVRKELIMHELHENLIRTQQGLPYLLAHPKTESDGFTVPKINHFIFSK